MKRERNVHKMQIIERGFGFTDKVRRKYMIPLNAAPSSSVLLEVVYFEGILWWSSVVCSLSVIDGKERQHLVK